MNVPNQQFTMDPPVFQKARTVTHSKIFFLSQVVDFTSVANELVTAYTDPQGFSIIVRAGWSNLLNCRVRFKTTADDRALSDEQVPINAQVGYPGRYLPLQPLAVPIYLRAQSLIRGDFINTGSEAAGDVNWYGEIVGKDEQVYVKRSESFWLFADLSSTSLVARTAQIEDDILVLGAACHEGAAPLSVINAKIIDNGTNEAWSSEQIPLYAMASPPGTTGIVTATATAVTRYHRPYLLRAFNQLRVEYSAAAANQYIAFLCERLLN